MLRLFSAMRMKQLVFLSLILLLSCKPETNPGIKVEIVKNESGYQLTRNGEPFYIKGAVAWNKFDLIRLYGGNAVRTSTRGNRLELADSLGLTCMVNLPVRAERDGMDYNDSLAVKEQFEKVIGMVEKYKGLECVLFWSLGNELDWIPPGVPNNKKVWTHLNNLAIKIHEIDPDHPVMTTIGSVHKEVMDDFIKGAPEIDLLGFNEYGNILELADRIREFGWTKPYVFTEWGPSGFWQVPLTSWDAPIEETSSMKAELYKLRYEEAILADHEMCLGSFVFLWNQHQERTHTWFGMFDKDWNETEAVGVMQYEWTGEWPDNSAPGLDSIFIDDHTAYGSIILKAGSSHTGSVYTSDPDGDTLFFSWEILSEGTKFPYGGRGEEKPPVVPGLIEDSTKQFIQFKAPESEGAYRLFVYIYDGHNHFATANIPFYTVE
ncbi:MAG: hypothetical protein ISS19_08670 [Bacteroidales bacterium]|nr:hypothetical protein [Bacteroidales bacterium]